MLSPSLDKKIYVLGLEIWRSEERIMLSAATINLFVLASGKNILYIFTSLLKKKSPISISSPRLPRRQPKKEKKQTNKIGKTVNPSRGDYRTRPCRSRGDFYVCGRILIRRVLRHLDSGNFVSYMGYTWDKKC
jgi:hypothetical protein